MVDGTGSVKIERSRILSVNTVDDGMSNMEETDRNSSEDCKIQPVRKEMRVIRNEHGSRSSHGKVSSNRLEKPNVIPRCNEQAVVFMRSIWNVLSQTRLKSPSKT